MGWKIGAGARGMLPSLDAASPGLEDGNLKDLLRDAYMEYGTFRKVKKTKKRAPGAKRP